MKERRLRLLTPGQRPRPFLTKGAPIPDRLFLLAVLLLSAAGSLAVASAGGPYAAFRYGDEYFFIKRQILWGIIGFFVMYFASRTSTDFLFEYAGVFYGFSLLLLLLVLVIGFAGNGAKRWISIGPVTVQPSEIAKFTVVLMLAKYFSRYENRALDRRRKSATFLFGTLYPLLILLLPILLIMLQKHLSCIIILGLLGISVIAAAGVDLRYLAWFAGAGGLGVTALALFTDYTKERITVWLNPEKYKLTGGWQTLQGLMAIGSGGLFGVGVGKSVLKHSYISEPANDMIFTVVCEECGLVGALCVMLLFGFLAVRGYRVARRAKSSFERLLCFGIVTKTVLQALLNIAVVTNAVPNTGISLPFFSYGGSSLLMLFFEMGVVLSISREARISP